MGDGGSKDVKELLGKEDVKMIDVEEIQIALDDKKEQQNEVEKDRAKLEIENFVVKTIIKPMMKRVWQEIDLSRRRAQ